LAFSIHSGVSGLLLAIEVGGVLAFALSGLLEARRKDMDMVGSFTIAFITAFGGGTLRDLLLERRPFFWVEHQGYTWLVFILALVFTPFARHLRLAMSEKIILVADALGLGLFSALGASEANHAGMPVFVCAMMGVITGVFGGVLRDVICNEIPMVFRNRHLYATCSFAGSWIYLLLDWLEAPPTLALIASIMVTCAMRLLAVRLELKLPG
jgi:uncharacterized membrane protein YeiH